MAERVLYTELAAMAEAEGLRHGKRSLLPTSIAASHSPRRQGMRHMHTKHARRFTRMPSHRRTHTHAHTHSRRYTHVHACTDTQTRTGIHTHACTDTHTHTHRYVHVCDSILTGKKMTFLTLMHMNSDTSFQQSKTENVQSNST